MSDLTSRAGAVLEAHWREPGFCVPHADVYPVRFLWDSAFHVVVWAALDRPERAHTELATIFATATPAGFVPHMGYHLDPEASVGFWGRRGASSITQPPMYGHAVAELTRAGIAVDPAVVDAARRGLLWLVDHRRQPDGTIAVVHPWETGMDDSPRWDGALGSERPWTAEAWRRRKGELVSALVTDGDGVAIDSSSFRVGSAGFTALVSFNLAELGWATHDRRLVDCAGELSLALGPLLDPRRGWRDGAGSGAGGGARTLDGLLPLLVVEPASSADGLLAQLVDRAAYGGPYGPAFVHRDEPAHDPAGYWRGSVWPQVTYLLWLAARRHGAGPVAEALATGLRRGALGSGLAEHWHADSGAALGAVPLSWAGLAAVV